VHPVRLEREHLSLSVAAMPDVSEGDLLGMLAFLCFYNRHNRAIGMAMTTRPDGGDGERLNRVGTQRNHLSSVKPSLPHSERCIQSLLLQRVLRPSIGTVSWSLQRVVITPRFVSRLAAEGWAVIPRGAASRSPV
jgi:hypothetical protein